LKGEAGEAKEEVVEGVREVKEGAKAVVGK